MLETSDGEYRSSPRRLRGRRGRGVHARVPRTRARRPLRRHPRRRDVRRSAPVHHRQAELRLRAGQRPPVVGQPHRARLAAAGQAVGPDELAGRHPRPLRPADRGPLHGRRRLHPRRRHRRRRAGRREPPRAHARIGRQRQPGRGGRRGHRRDRLHRTAARSARARRGHLRAKPAAGPDAVLGERLVARHLFRGHHHDGRAGHQEERRRRHRRRPRRTIQRHGILARRSPSGTSGSRSRASRSPQTRWSTGCSRKLPTRPSCGTRRATWHGPSWSGPTDHSTTASCRSRHSSTAAGPTAQR